MGVQRSFSVGCAARPFFVLAADWDAGALLLGARVGVEVLDVIGRALCLRGRLDEERGVVAQDLHPALEVGRAVGNRGVRDVADTT